MSKRHIKVPLSEKIDAATAESIDLLKSDLAALGIRLSVPNALPGGTLVFEYDSEAHKRNAGRKKKAIPISSQLSKKTREQLDEWLLSASIADIQEALGVSRATAYRRVREARSQVEYAVVSLSDIDKNR